MKHLLRLCSNRKSSRELLSTSEASWATTKSVGMWFFPQDLPVFYGVLWCSMVFPNWKRILACILKAYMKLKVTDSA